MTNPVPTPPYRTERKTDETYTPIVFALAKAQMGENWDEATAPGLGHARRTLERLSEMGYVIAPASQPAADLDVERLAEAIEEILGTAHGKSLASDILAAIRDAKGTP
jgi:hypothetical protein